MEEFDGIRFIFCIEKKYFFANQIVLWGNGICNFVTSGWCCSCMHMSNCGKLVQLFYPCTCSVPGVWPWPFRQRLLRIKPQQHFSGLLKQQPTYWQNFGNKQKQHKCSSMSLWWMRPLKLQRSPNPSRCASRCFTSTNTQREAEKTNLPWRLLYLGAD